MHTFIFLVLIKNINGGGSWNVTPCQIRMYACRFFGQSKHTEAGALEIQGNVLRLKQINL
ncbi:Uncharacterised protein [Shigella sonnei]|uniref:Uncharacterized protein n=1 Tax=Escherichia coli TaxID=562 RepID=A0A377HI03_ECOLX|nr:Uncharacterised protein [Escherichia coli]SJA30978.1 Uncharacterised protein [Shigella sonnei]STK07981.1 Uncharacterised protein [Escherichia coli]STK42626.1 Uncharacterised protein [Escherichia coli]STO17807.1 Uncharacterised protein [Escherichia coli]